jgi:hypothetical protein
MATWTCETCGHEKEGRCKPKKCPTCQASGGFVKKSEARPVTSSGALCSFVLGLVLLLLSAGQSSAHERQVLFDQGHGQLFVVDQDGPLQLSELASTLCGNGLEVVASRQPLSAEHLKGVTAVVISGPFIPLAQQEIEALLGYLDQGGRVALMLHIGQPLIPLLHRLGVDVANGVVRETTQVIEGEPLNFTVSDLTPHPLTANLTGFALFGAWPLMNFGGHGQEIARSGDQAWVDLDGTKKRSPGDAVQSFAVLVAGEYGAGSFAVFGDDAIFQNQFLKGYNQPLADNLGRWLAGN